MLARLQQATTLGLILLSLIWALVALQRGHPGWGAAGALALLFGYAAVLAVEFALLAAVHGTDPTPRPTWWQYVRAWCGEVLSAPMVFCWRQPFRSQRWPDHLPAAAHGRRGVLLIHGFVCNRGIWNPWLRRLRQANVPYVAMNLEPVFGSIDEMAHLVERGVRVLEKATGRPPVVVAHSMGGLVLRCWWSQQADAGRVHRAITIATPHRGTWLARFAWTPNGRQMQQSSTWIDAIGRREPPDRASRFVCFYGHCDNIVFPPVAATLDGADNRHIPGTAHVHMVSRPEPWQALQQALQA